MGNGVMECWSNGVLGFPEPNTPPFQYFITPFFYADLASSSLIFTIRLPSMSTIVNR